MSGTARLEILACKVAFWLASSTNENFFELKGATEGRLRGDVMSLRARAGV